jgi:hypothetical protein
MKRRHVLFTLGLVLGVLVLSWIATNVHYVTWNDGRPGTADMSIGIINIGVDRLTHTIVISW